MFTASNGNFDIQKKHIDNKGEFVVSSGIQNAGIIGKSSVNATIFNPNTITIDMFGNVFFRDFYYKMVTHARVFSISSDIISNYKIGLYLSIKLNFLNKIFSYNNMASWLKIKELSISLPVINNLVDFKFMESCIRELEEERIRELTAYLKVSGLEDYNLTEDEQNAIDLINNNKIEFESFKIKELFKLTSSKKKFNANELEFGGKHPYVVRTSQNNGIRDYINEDKHFLNPGRTISFGQDTATIFYQEQPYFTGDKIKILEFIPKELNAELACFLLSAMNKSFKSFQWGQSSFNENILNNTMIKLPIKTNSQIDYKFMKTYIKAIEKLVIKKVVLWKDKIIDKTKEVVNS